MEVCRLDLESEFAGNARQRDEERGRVRAAAHRYQQPRAGLERALAPQGAAQDRLDAA
jgi:hypothetical protein